jgi:hypothetical protein
MAGTKGRGILSHVADPDFTRRAYGDPRLTAAVHAGLDEQLMTAG